MNRFRKIFWGLFLTVSGLLFIGFTGIYDKYFVYNPDNEIVGKWINKSQNIEIEFNKDGKCNIKSKSINITNGKWFFDTLTDGKGHVSMTETNNKPDLLFDAGHGLVRQKFPIINKNEILINIASRDDIENQISFVRVTP